MSKRWEVVGGTDKGGILVRSGQATTSEQLSERLATGAIVHELELAGERLHYEKLSGAGPETGWVSITLKGKNLLERRDEKDVENRELKPDPGADPPDVQKSCSVRSGDYYVTLGVLFKKPGEDPETQKILKLTRKVGSIVHTTGKIWKGPTGGLWVELDVSSGDSGAGEKPGYVMIDASGFGTPGPCLQIASAEDGEPLVLRVKRPDGVTAWDKTKEDKDILVHEKTPISELKAVIGMLFGLSRDSVTIFGTSGSALQDSSTIQTSGFQQGHEVKFESSEKVLNLIVMTPLENYEGQKLVDLTVRDTWTVGQMKELLCNLTGLQKTKTIMAKGKMGERVSEGAHLADSDLVSTVGYTDGDEVGFIYLGDLAIELAPFLAKKK